MTHFSFDAEDSRQLGYSTDLLVVGKVKHLDMGFIVIVNSIVSCEHIWFSGEQKYKILVCIPALNVNIDMQMYESDKNSIDFVALHYLPKDAPDSYVPIKL